VSTQQNPAVTPPNAAGSYTYALTVTDLATNCVSATQAVSVLVEQPQLTLSANRTQLCNTDLNSTIAERATLTATPSGFANGAALSYLWTGPNGFTTTTTTPNITPNVPIGQHSYQVTVTNPATGCSVGPRSITITQQVPELTFTTSGPVCAGGQVQLGVQAAGFAPGLTNSTFLRCPTRPRLARA
jgi:hypothetical protein